MSISADNEAEPVDEVAESVSLEEAIAGFGDNPPDGFVMTMIFWKRELSDAKHKAHNFLEMLKTNFMLDIRKRDVVMKDMHFYQVDMFWYGDVKYMQKTMEDLDAIVVQNMDSLKINPTMNVGFCMRPDSSPDDNIF
jgi:hypothetical protein